MTLQEQRRGTAPDCLPVLLQKPFLIGGTAVGKKHADGGELGMAMHARGYVSPETNVSPLSIHEKHTYNALSQNA